MRTFRLIGTTLLMAMLAANFTACSDDEDEQTIIEQANLIGKWQPGLFRLWEGKAGRCRIFPSRERECPATE